ncbi:M15 family metallopeptidase [Cellulomonas sp. URHB0016]
MRPATRGMHAAPRRLRMPSARRHTGQHAARGSLDGLALGPWTLSLAGMASSRALVAAVVLASTTAGLVTGQLVGGRSHAASVEAARHAVVVEQALVASDDDRTLSRLSEAARRQESGRIVAAHRQAVVDTTGRAQRVVVAASTLATSTPTLPPPAEPHLPVDQPIEPAPAAALPVEPQLPAELPADLAGLGESLSRLQDALASQDATTAQALVGDMEQLVLTVAQVHATDAEAQTAADLAVVPDDEHAAVVGDMVAQVRLAAASVDVVGAARAAVSAGDAAAAVARAAGEERARLAARVSASPNGVDDGAWGRHANGRIPAEALAHTDFDGGVLLRTDAARALERLDVAFRAKFGRDIAVSDSYRTLAGQHATWDQRPTLAATPGTSNHGWGLAVDLAGGIGDAGSAQHRWMDAHAGEYGWVNPTWAQASRFEPWHWEYVG